MTNRSHAALEVADAYGIRDEGYWSPRISWAHPVMRSIAWVTGIVPEAGRQFNLPRYCQNQKQFCQRTNTGPLHTALSIVYRIQWRFYGIT